MPVALNSATGLEYKAAHLPLVSVFRIMELKINVEIESGCGINRRDSKIGKTLADVAICLEQGVADIDRVGRTEI